MDPTFVVYVLMLQYSHSTEVAPLDIMPSCIYEDGSELKQNEFCYHDGGDTSHSYVAWRTPDTTPTTNQANQTTNQTPTQTNMSYMFLDGHLETDSWQN